MIIKIRNCLDKLKSQKGSIVFLIASLAVWIFIIGFVTDFVRILALRRQFTIQFDHALKAAAKQLDEEQLADRVIYILPDEARTVFAEVFAEGMGLVNSYPYFTPGEQDRGYAGTIEVLEFNVLNDVPIEDSISSGVIFDYPAVHGVIKLPIETCFWRYFGIEEMNIMIHCDASTEILDI